MLQNDGKRLMQILHWVFSLLICVIFAALVFTPSLHSGMINTLGKGQVLVIDIILFLISAALIVAQGCALFRRPKYEDKGSFTVGSDEAGNVSVAVAAIEQMVRQSVHNLDGLVDMKVGVDNLGDAVDIDVAAIVSSGTHIPTISSSMQDCIKKYLEQNCGVAVRAVSVIIESMVYAAEPAENAPLKVLSDTPESNADGTEDVEYESAALEPEPVEDISEIYAPDEAQSFVDDSVDTEIPEVIEDDD